MSQLAEQSKEVCIKCGQLIYVQAPVKLETLVHLKSLKLNPKHYVEAIVQAENLPRDVVQDFVDHRMGMNCNKTQPPCPKCGAALKTWHARHCLKCDWSGEVGSE